MITAADAARRLRASPTIRRVCEVLPPGQWLLAGGSVRDRLLGVRSRDFDLVILGDPEPAAIQVAKRTRGRLVPLGAPPDRIWRVVAESGHLDVWGVKGDLATDILRRDFTVNALMWWLPKGPLVDLVGGLADLASGRVHMVAPGNFATDPLRVLRGFRLSATHRSFRLTAATERVLAAAAPGLRSVARERLRDEIGLLVRAEGAPRALASMLRLGILESLTGARPRHADFLALAALLAAVGSRRGTARTRARDMAVLPLVLTQVDELAVREPAPVAARLTSLGWPRGSADRIVAAAASGERLVTALLRGRGDDGRRECVMSPDSCAALSWASARLQGMKENPALAVRVLSRWWTRFSRLPPLLDGTEVADLLHLAPGPERRGAVQALRIAQALGQVRTAAQARRWLAAGRFP